MQHNQTTLADESTARMVSEQNRANPSTTEQTIEASVDDKMEKKMNKHKKQADEATTAILDRLAQLERELQVERSQRVESEKELKQLKTSFESKEEVPPDSGTVQTIESDRSEHQHPKSTVKFRLAPPTKKHHQPPPKHHSRNRGNQRNIHNQANNRRRKQDKANVAEQDTSDANTSLNQQPFQEHSRSNRKKKNMTWKRQNDTRNH
eukprot:scaffold56907_cov38-Cyclotella_meneghiniana.AAC.4